MGLCCIHRAARRRSARGTAILGHAGQLHWPLQHRRAGARAADGRCGPDIGRAVRAVRGQLDMAEAFGVDGARLKIVVFVYAALLACVSGWLYAHLQRFVNPTPFSLPQGIEYLFMAVIGGAGSVWGAVIGATLITLSKQVLQDWLPVLLGRSGNFEMVVFGVLMVIVLQRAREGVWPWIALWLPKSQPAAVPDAPPLPSRDHSVSSGALLEVKKARKQFGGLVAVSDLSFAIQPGEILGLIG